MTLTIVSGAAPGVEQGAIEAAVNLALHWQGWASEQSLLTVAPIYRTGLQPTSATDPGMVRRLNIQGCDGALVFSTSMALVGVPAFVDRYTERMGRAFLHVTLNPAALRAPLPAEVVARVRDWLRDLPSRRVYVTGPSEDDEPGIQRAVRDALIAILESFAVEEVRQVTRELETLAAEIARVGGQPDHIEINPANADAALAAGMEVEIWLEDPGSDRHRVPHPKVTEFPDPPEGLDEIQRAQLDASVREAERDIRDEPPTPGDQTE